MRHPYGGLRPDQIGTAWVCVRFYPRTRPEGDLRPCGPTIHENPGHSQVGDVSVAITADGHLELLLRDLPKGAAIGFPDSRTDEFLSTRAVDFGPSGGNSQTVTTVSIGDPASPYGRKVLDLTIPAHYAKLVNGETSNVWFKLEHDLSAVVTPSTSCTTTAP